MKRFFGICLALILLLSACAGPAGSREEPGNDATGGTGEPARTAEGGDGPAAPDPGSLAEPPELVVSTLNQADSAAARLYGCTWQARMEEQPCDFIACGIHPLDDPGEAGYAILYTAFPGGSLPPLEGVLPGMLLPVFYLDFGDIPPETVTARRWPAAYIGRAGEHAGDSEEVEVDASEGFALLPLGDGDFVYEIHAGWGETGNADYVFRTLPQLRDRA